MKKYQHYIRIIGLILGSAILIRQIIILLFNINKDFLLKFAWNEILASFTFILLALIMQIISWKFVMNLIYVNIPILGAIQGYMLSFLPRYIPGTVWGYLSRNEWLKNEYGVDKYLTSIGSLLEIFLIFIAIINLLSIYFVITLNNFFLFFLSFILIVLSFIFIKTILNSRLPFVNKTIRVNNFSFRFWLLGLLSETMMWIFYGLSIHLLTLNVSTLTNFLSILYSTISFSIAWLIGFVILFIPSGIGVREEVLANLLNYHYDFGYIHALGVGVLLRAFISIAELILSLVGLLKQKVKKKA